MWILFNTAGAITKKINNGSGARVSVVGNGFDIIAKFEGIDASNIGDYTATIQVELPNGQVYQNPRAMTISPNELFTTQPNDGDVTPLVDGQTYAVFKWHPDKEDDVPFTGTYKATIRLWKGANVYVSGRLDFFVEDAVFDGEVYIEPGTYDALMVEVNKKQNKYDLTNVRHYTADPTGDELNSLAGGQIIVIDYPNNKYVVKKVVKTTVEEVTTTSLVQILGDNYALDNNVVHKTGNETVGGTKTFTSPVNVGSNPINFANNAAISGNSSVELKVSNEDNKYTFGTNSITHKSGTTTHLGSSEVPFNNAYLSENLILSGNNSDIVDGSNNPLYVKTAGGSEISGNTVFEHAFKDDTDSDNEFITKSVTDALGVRIDNITASGRYLAAWDCSVPSVNSLPGGPEVETTTEVYNYKTGDYYIISAVGSGTNYMPNGTNLPIGTTKTTVPNVAYTGTTQIGVGDAWRYNGSTWTLEINSQKDIPISRVVGLQATLDSKLGNESPELTSMGNTNKSVATKEYVDDHAGGAINIRDGAGFNSLKQRDIIYNDLVADLVAKTGYTQEQVEDYLASIGIVSDINGHVYSINGVSFGAGNTVGSSTDFTKGVSSFAVGNNLIIESSNAAGFGNGGEYTISGTTEEKEAQRRYLTNLADAGGTVTGTGDARVGTTGVIKGYNSYSFGNQNYVDGLHNFVVGNQNITKTTANNNLIAGLNNYSKNEASLISGSNNTGTGKNVTMSGTNNTASGTSCFVTGQENTSSHWVSAAFGLRTKTGKNYQFVTGILNEGKNNTLFEVGNGTLPSTRSNAFEVYEDSTVKFGSLTDGTTTKTVTQILNNAAIWGNITGTLNTQSDLWAELQDIRAVAEGKTKSIVIDTTDTSIDTSGAIVYCKSDGTGMTVSETQAYVSGLTNYNTIFELTTDTIDLAASDKYYIFSGIDSVHKMIVLSEEFLGGNGPFKTGDIVLVVKVEVPDRWYSGMGVFSKLESKIDLSNYYAKNASLIPSASGFDIGSASKTFNNLFLTGNISDGTNTTSVAKINNNLADTYSSSSAYAVGDLVIHEGSLYKCNTTISSPGESWTAGHWDATSISANVIESLEVIAPPADSSHLTTAEQLKFRKGCIVKGEFMNCNTIIFLPPNLYSDVYHGMAICTDSNYNDLIVLTRYSMNGEFLDLKTNSINISMIGTQPKIYSPSSSGFLLGGSNNKVYLGNTNTNVYILNKLFPFYPTTDGNYHLRDTVSNGSSTLSWSEDRETTAVTFVEWE